MAKQFCSDLTDAEFSSKLGGVSVERIEGSWTNQNLSSSYKPSFRKYGKVVEANGTLISTVDLPINTELCNIPSGYANTDNVDVVVASGTNVGVLRFYNGKLSVKNTSATLKANNYYPYHATWIID